MSIRLATPQDGSALFDIYGYYIETDTATFEITQLSSEIMSQRVEETLEHFPYLVYEQNGQVVGYAYAHRVGAREGFDYSAEMCIYLHKDCCGGGIGKKLYAVLEALLTRQGICNGYASITHENEGSIAFHKRLGFTMVGQLTKAGYKFGRWLDVCWMWKPLIEIENPVKVIPFAKIDKTEIQEIIKERG